LRDPAAKAGSLWKQGRVLLNEHAPVQAHLKCRAWVENVAKWLELIDPALSAKWSGLPSSALMSGGSYSNDPEAWAHFQSVVNERLRWLGEAISSHRHAEDRRLSVSAVAPQQQSRKVFVVHGHDEVAREAMARFLEKVGLETIILHEQPDQGLTIIEKFESYAGQVSFAVILLTPDDLGGAASAPAQVARARQNVIFELGYFVGKLGRGRACLLRKGAVEIPSDLYGVIYTDMDAAEGWKLKLVKELKAAGLDFDANKVWS
jgi:predicted nucleotide-binding protein